MAVDLVWAMLPFALNRAFEHLRYRVSKIQVDVAAPSQSRPSITLRQWLFTSSRTALRSRVRAALYF